jgi:hypothetical protein
LPQSALRSGCPKRELADRNGAAITLLRRRLADAGCDKGGINNKTSDRCGGSAGAAMAAR